MKEIKLVIVKYFDWSGESLCGDGIFSTKAIKEILSKEKFHELVQEGTCSVKFDFDEESGTDEQHVVYNMIDIIKNTEGKVFIDIDRLKEIGDYVTYFPLNELKEIIKD